MVDLKIRRVRAEIEEAAKKSGRRGKEITLVAVTKSVPTERITSAYEAGLKNFGENRVQEALPKIKVLSPDIRWHFIGHLQTNKVEFVVSNFCLIHSLDRLKLAQSLNGQGEKEQIVVHTLVQVNVAREQSKFGLEPQELGDFLIAVREYPFVRVQGLMTIAPYTTDPEEVRPVFRQLYHLFNTIKIPGVEMRYLSMGMSNDFRVAIEEGANIVRIGSALFGKRN
ncbi:MAG: YggS family pyridoxal phosphate-dependent enzyme [Dethiobacteria bacterium]|nr:YggS family pyridoxal phosphate-dependent enzyme [Bacillota bacterium]